MGSAARDAWYFLAVPDCDAARPVVRRLGADVLLSHPSGRPWLLGCLPADQVVAHAEGANRLALVGVSAPARLDTLGASIRSAADLARVSARVAGSYCVLGSLDGGLYAQGSAVGVRRVFHAEIDGVRVVSDRADLLAELGGLPLDDVALALRMVLALPQPYPEIPLWPGVRPVAPPDYVTVPADGRGWTTGTWWRPPEPRLSRARGAALLRAALDAAVGARTAGGRSVSCDLSGGLDSTPLCYFAAAGPTGVLALTSYNDDPGGRKDLAWAHMALPSMPGVHQHIVESTEDMPGMFGDLPEMHDPLDEPTHGHVSGPRISRRLLAHAGRGIDTNLNGLGGDHLLGAPFCAEHTLFRRRPVLGWRRARARHLAEGRPLRDTARELLDRRCYRTWLAEGIADAAAGTVAPARFGEWTIPPALPPWWPAPIRTAALHRLRTVATGAEPLAGDRAGHAELSALREAAAMVRSTAQLGARAGVANEAPLLDDHVVEAVLSVRREERFTPVEWKPLMKAAMRGLLPEEFLRRTTKVAGSAQAVRGLAAHHAEVSLVCEELFDRGLADRAALGRALRPDAGDMPRSELNLTLNAALFLRNHRRNRIVPATRACGPQETDGEGGDPDGARREAALRQPGGQGTR